MAVDYTRKPRMKYGAFEVVDTFGIDHILVFVKT